MLATARAWQIMLATTRAWQIMLATTRAWQIMLAQFLEYRDRASNKHKWALN